MDQQLQTIIQTQGGVATNAQILSRISRRQLQSAVNCGALERMWQGIYCIGEPDLQTRLLGLDLSCGARVPVCLGTAAAIHGFDTEQPADLHVLEPIGSRLRSCDGLVVHRRDGAPLNLVQGRLVNTASWTAVEVARSLRRRRALATLDAALRSGTCTRAELWRSALEQAGRRGIVAVRNLIPLADGRAESPMESEARLVMLDGGLPTPELQFEVIDGNGELRRLDFAWPEQRVAVEYDGVDWHGNPDALRNDRRRTAALMDIGWVVIAIVFEDVRHREGEMIARISGQLCRAQAA
ncbi:MULTISPECIES: DUF559 domain-containing protein [unclassified Mycolicibacterium]|uniref:DUF559 domain-containing protein n=1 Tax=unclassified Mycolicibacterium TaxID=2636767 RepID=UPI0012DD4BD6|nr:MULTISPECIES: DUF559 domain-containing protein [unclassified Mycolicibacterium]MUL81116.1 DUF559 domain-containing protein [Mycolicibacterium sp. CBMA 329]MUL86882.1 DUF559 domain-containing protein [Mycolicibacterium sp. CBMA 331]MUL98834.1 DUF559 domain-containing protein [Mycolicibacterium sp. CBMA 334]MUM29094.1 DUF559 domain-containing protein [Mycolicibacterium sp. CBMA 295]MUM37179.1 DUF559 domain-containing protein [Mycolicibacterium sp. CBMA 247]